MKKFSLLVQTLFTIIFPSCGQNASDQHLRLLYKNTVPVIQPEELAAGLQKKEPYVLLDARSPAEFKVSHLPNARFVDYDSFAVAQLKSLNRNTPLVVYCAVGVRSERIGEKLQKAGFKNVRNLYGGIFEWKNRGYPVLNHNNQPTDSVHVYNRYWGQWLVKGIKVYE